ncbi:MHYT domain-containing protein [Streptomonospora wellingtoniae]|uniref:MHYT domain-containing protein n=1 Tax=Streptomonospora wellingtoniae TaxID=3075544 RepID=A0ABU2KWU1_9ACTN|nr:MHYT domain-containing protein [Streptomonospora sp. DSM 45055]MDT0303767.1 MHYT domain-containing protein [Streptomonospora sp. DSM 45055]
MIEHFTYGWTTPAIAYAVSFIGSFIGLQTAARARSSTGGVRAGWLVLASVSLGAAGIWAMHFIAMMGSSVQSLTLRYDVVLTVLSGLLAVAAVSAALFWTTVRPGRLAIPGGGAVMGLGVVAMHYTGMASIRMQADAVHDPFYTAAAAVVALAASALVLLFSLRLQGPAATLLGSLVMAAAVSAVHYTAMFGMSVTALPQTPFDAEPSGAAMMDFFLPVFVGLGLLLMVISLILLLSPAEDDDARRPSRSPVPPVRDSVFDRRH